MSRCGKRIYFLLKLQLFKHQVAHQYIPLSPTSLHHSLPLPITHYLPSLTTTYYLPQRLTVNTIKCLLSIIHSASWWILRSSSSGGSKYSFFSSSLRAVHAIFAVQSRVWGAQLHLTTILAAATQRIDVCDDIYIPFLRLHHQKTSP